MIRADMIFKLMIKKITSYVSIFLIPLIEFGETIISLLSVCTVSIQRDMNGTMVMCKRDEVDNQLYSDFRSTFYFHNVQ